MKKLLLAVKSTPVAAKAIATSKNDKTLLAETQKKRSQAKVEAQTAI